jgi:hypothetical protein
MFLLFLLHVSDTSAYLRISLFYKLACVCVKMEILLWKYESLKQLTDSSGTIYKCDMR